MKKIFLALLIVFANASLALGWSGEPATSVNIVKRDNLSKGEAGGGSVPIGTVITWPASANPPDIDKWLECNGQPISQAAYPELFAIVGSNVPDYQGMFLRGVGGNSATLGMAQGDAIRNITANMWTDAAVHAFLGDILWSNGAILLGPLGSQEGIPQHDGGYGPSWFNFDASRVVPVANENRPVNKAVRYLIRAKL